MNCADSRVTTAAFQLAVLACRASLLTLWDNNSALIVRTCNMRALATGSQNACRTEASALHFHIFSADTGRHNRSITRFCLWSVGFMHLPVPGRKLRPRPVNLSAKCKRNAHGHLRDGAEQHILELQQRTLPFVRTGTRSVSGDR